MGHVTGQKQVGNCTDPEITFFSFDPTLICQDGRRWWSCYCTSL